MRRVLVVLALLVATVRPAQAQEAVPEDGRVPGATLVTAGVIGAVIGTAVGWHAGAALGWGGGDDPGLAGALLGGYLGGATGSAAGVSAASPRVTFLEAMGPGLVSGLAGVGTAVLLSDLTDGKYDATGVWIGFSVGTGAAAGVITWLMQSR